MRRSAGGEGFDAAWDKALALYDSRNPRPRVAPTGAGGRWARHRTRPVPRAAASPDAAFEALSRMPPGAEVGPEEALEIVTFADMLHPLLDRYLIKLQEERQARLEGRIVEADFCVRQLTTIELALDLGGAAGELLSRLKAPNGLEWVDVAATPMSVLLAGIRRDYWREKGEPERPGLAPLGSHDEAAARGEPIHYLGSRDGDYRDWCRRRDEKHRLAAEAQAAWEEKARADAAAWAARLQHKSAPAFAGEGDHAQHGGGAPSDVSDPEPRP